MPAVYLTEDGYPEYIKNSKKEIKISDPFKKKMGLQPKWRVLKGRIK